MAVREDFLDVGADVAAHLGADAEERVVRRRGAVRIEAEDDARRMGRVRLWLTELIIRLTAAERTIGQVLQLAAAALIADLKIELAVGAK